MTRPYLSLALLNYNEEGSIVRAARLCSRVLQRCGHSYELVLVDDGSTDRSRDLIGELTRELPCCRPIYHPRNLGIGAGIRTCYFETVGEWATWFPADLQADPAELPRLLEYLPTCDALITYRDASRRQEGRKRRFISACERFLVWLLFGIKLRDLHWVRMFHRDLLERMRLRSRSPFIDTEMVVAARRLGARIRQVELLDHPREFGVAKGARFTNLLFSMVDLASLRVRAFIPGQLRKSA